MGRSPRIRVPGITFHVVQRGHDRGRVFFEDDDYATYLLRLRRVSQRYATAIHAYVLMTNHVHLLMTPEEPDGISRTMQHVAGSYARRINERQLRTGSLWEGRYSASPIDSEFYCLACYRYIELNPVRAGMAASPGDYRWSSYRENMGQRALNIVQPHTCFLMLGETPHERIKRYRALVHEQLPARTLSRIRYGTSRSLPVGPQHFVDQIEARTGVAVQPRKRGRPRKSALERPASERSILVSDTKSGSN